MLALFGQFPVVDRLLQQAERSIALLARCQPKNGGTEQARVRSLLREGRVDRPRFSYGVVPDLSELRRELDRVASRLGNAAGIAGLYAARAEELSLEARLVEAIATPSMPRLSRQRFAPSDPDLASAALETARQWATLTPTPPEATTESDDEGSPASLLQRLRQVLGERRIPFRVERCASLSAAAATGDGVVLVAPGRPLSARETERIVVHEVLGHVLPRHRAASEHLRLFSLGSAGGNDEQEGYALFAEAEHGYLDDGRKRELGLRHLAAVSVQEGADWVETTRLLRAASATLDEAVLIASRVHRAGGLAREVVYLPALHRVRLAKERDPRVLDWLGRGRLNLEAIAVVRGQARSLDATSG